MFKDRKDAALQLAEALEKYKGKGAIVLGIPRGGAETAFYVAKELDADFSLLISRKLGHPENPEYALGAIAEDGTIYLNELSQAEASQETIDVAAHEQKKEIERRIKILRKGEMCKKKGAAKIVVAAPVSGDDAKKTLGKEADEVVILETPVFYYAVSQGYQSFYNLSDDDALEFMERWKREKV